MPFEAIIPPFKEPYGKCRNKEIYRRNLNENSLPSWTYSTPLWVRPRYSCNQNEFRQFGLIGCAVRKATDQTASKMPQQIYQEKIDFVLAKGERIKKECAEQYNRLDVFICMAKRIPTLYEKSGLEHSDLFALYWAKVLVLAEKRLNRKITNIEFQSREQQLRLWITEKQRERDR